MSTTLTCEGSPFLPLSGGAISFFFTRSQKHTGTLILNDLWIALAICAFTFVGIALCPLLHRKQLPNRTSSPPTATCGAERQAWHTSITHYLDVARFRSADQYFSCVSEIHGTDIPANGIVREMLMECYELAIILAAKMRWLAWGFLAGAAAMLVLIVDLAVFGTAANDGSDSVTLVSSQVHWIILVPVVATGVVLALLIDRGMPIPPRSGAR